MPNTANSSTIASTLPKLVPPNTKIPPLDLTHLHSIGANRTPMLGTKERVVAREGKGSKLTLLM